MRGKLKRLAAAVTAATLVLAGAVSPAYGQETTRDALQAATANTGYLIGGRLLLPRDDYADLTWNSSAGTLLTRLEPSIRINDILQKTTSVSTHHEGATEVSELRNIDQGNGSNTGIEVLRTYRFDGTTATLEVTLSNTTSRDQKLQVDLSHSGVRLAPTFTAISGDNTLLATTKKPDYTVRVEFEGNPQATGFSGGNFLPEVPYGAEGKKGQRSEGSARYQTGRWFKPLKPGETFKSSISVTATPAVSAADSDGDGIPDEWERHGFRPSPNEYLDFPRWGASPDKPDVFLQLNWMQPEVDSKTCAPGGRYARTPRGYTDFVACAEANKNEYRPSKKALRDLIDLFQDKGINLHIDAGSWFNTFTTNPDEMKGGPTVPYRKPYYANEPVIRPTLIADRDYYLGTRDGVFRLGIIGDQMLAGDYSSGVSTTPGSSFYVAKQSIMTSDEQVRNTILHELGHNLGLTHAGTSTVAENRRLANVNLPNYLSTMNYLYQFTHFGYSDREYRSSSTLPRICNVKKCYTGSYRVPADWDNLLLADGIRHFVIPETDHHEDSTIRDLEVNGADQNSGKGGFRLTQVPDKLNGIIPALPDNVITGEITNRGRTDHTFILEATSPGGPLWRQKFRVEGIPKDLPKDDSTNPTAGKRSVDIPIEFGDVVPEDSLPVTIRLFNEAGVEQFNETFSIPVLDYSVEELSTVVDEVLADPNGDPKAKEAAKKVLERLEKAKKDKDDGNGKNPGDKPVVPPTIPGKPATPPLSGEGSSHAGSSLPGSSRPSVERGAEWKIPVTVFGSILGLVGLAGIWEQLVGR